MAFSVYGKGNHPEPNIVIASGHDSSTPTPGGKAVAKLFSAVDTVFMNAIKFPEEIGGVLAGLKPGETAAMMYIGGGCVKDEDYPNQYAAFVYPAIKKGVNIVFVEKDPMKISAVKTAVLRLVNIDEMGSLTSRLREVSGIDSLYVLYKIQTLVEKMVAAAAPRAAPPMAAAAAPRAAPRMMPVPVAAATDMDIIVGKVQDWATADANTFQNPHEVVCVNAANENGANAGGIARGYVQAGVLAAQSPIGSCARPEDARMAPLHPRATHGLRICNAVGPTSAAYPDNQAGFLQQVAATVVNALETIADVPGVRAVVMPGISTGIFCNIKAWEQSVRQTIVDAIAKYQGERNPHFKVMLCAFDEKEAGLWRNCFKK